MADVFRYEPASGLLEREGPLPGAWTVCTHLRGPLGRLLHLGAAVVGATDGWSRTDLAVTLSRGPALEEADRALGPLSSPVSSWRNDDSHYAIEFGLACSSCRHALSWPQRSRAID